MGYCLCSRNWIVYIWTGFDNWTQLQDWTMSGEQTFGLTLGYDLNVIWLCTWFQVLGFSSCLYSGSGNLYVISGNLYLGIDVLYCLDQSVHLVQLGHSASMYGSSLLWHFYIPASSQYCIFQLQVQLYFHFQLDFLLPVLVFWQELTRHAQF